MEDRKALAEIKDKSIANLLAHCDEDFLESFELSDREIERLKRTLKKNFLSEGFSVPMICTGDGCVFKVSCPFVEVESPPMGRKCPLELMLMNQWKNEYVESLDVDWTDRTERILILELIEIDILNARANTVLSTEGFIMENPVGVSEQTGEPVMHKQKHIALELKELMYNRRSKVLKEMIATREAKSKLMEGLKLDPSVYAAELREKANKLRDDHDEVKIIDADCIEEINENK